MGATSVAKPENREEDIDVSIVRAKQSKRAQVLQCADIVEVSTVATKVFYQWSNLQQLKEFADQISTNLIDYPSKSSTLKIQVKMK